MFGGDFKGVDLMGGTTMEIKVSVIRFENEVVSARLVVSGDGKLESMHRIPEEKVGVAYYRQEGLVKRIQACKSARYIPSEGSFSHEIITKEVTVK